MPITLRRQDHRCPQLAGTADTEDLVVYLGKPYPDAPLAWWLRDWTNGHDIREWAILFCPFCGVELDAPGEG